MTYESRSERSFHRNFEPENALVGVPNGACQNPGLIQVSQSEAFIAILSQKMH